MLPLQVFIGLCGYYTPWPYGLYAHKTHPQQVLYLAYTPLNYGLYITRSAHCKHRIVKITNVLVSAVATVVLDTWACNHTKGKDI